MNKKTSTYQKRKRSILRRVNAQKKDVVNMNRLWKNQNLKIKLSMNKRKLFSNKRKQSISNLNKNQMKYIKKMLSKIYRSKCSFMIKQKKNMLKLTKHKKKNSLLWKKIARN